MTVVTVVTMFQLPSRDKYNCASFSRFRVYKKRHLPSGGQRYVLIQIVFLPQAYLRNVNPYKNLTIGVSLVNNADLESAITDYVFVGSQYTFH